MTMNKLNFRVKSKSRIFLNLFLRGLLVVLPIALTIIIFISILSFLGNALGLNNLSYGLILLYLILGILVITLIGQFTQGVVAQQVIEFVEGIIEKAPGLSWIFGTTKDMTEACVGENKKFNKPVKVKYVNNLYRIGFLTKDDLTEFGMPGLASVYLPSSYSIAGEIVIVEAKDYEIIDGDPSEIMKFLLSGGVTEIK